MNSVVENLVSFTSKVNLISRVSIAGNVDIVFSHLVIVYFSNRD